MLHRSSLQPPTPEGPPLQWQEGIAYLLFTLHKEKCSIYEVLSTRLRKGNIGMHQPNWLSFILPAVVVVSLAFIATASGQDVSTSFEDDAPNFGDFTLGTPPKTVTFTGGFTQNQNVGDLYRTGDKSFMAASGDTATIICSMAGSVH